MKSRKDNKHSGSLSKAWGIDKQDRWQALKQEAINDAVIEYLRKPHPAFTDLYSFLVKKRVVIAQELSPDISDKIKTSRQENLYEFATTIIGNNNKYSDYFQLLTDRYNLFTTGDNDCKSKIPDVELSTLYYIFQEDILSGKEIEITAGDITYSSLLKVKACNSSGKENEYIGIAHTPASNVPAIMDRIEVLYQLLINEQNSSNKIKLIKEITWHLSHAMPQQRGSAAICEMLLEVLLKGNSITRTEPRPSLPLDIIALFSRTPEEFSKDYIINLEIEQ